MSVENLKEDISKERKIIDEINSLHKHLKGAEDKKEKEMMNSQIDKLKEQLKVANEKMRERLEGVSLARPLEYLRKKVPPQEKTEKIKIKKVRFAKEIKISALEKDVLKRLGKKEKRKEKKKIQKPSSYIKTANKFFSKTSREWIKKKAFVKVERDIIKTNLDITPTSYISVILFTTALSVVVSLGIFIFLLFFSLSLDIPIITKVTEGLGTRFLKVFWILFSLPIVTFLFMYFYPSLEKRSAEYQIDQELPFATIHMSAISGSLLEPSKIFKILIQTKEYHYLEKEFTKIINEINIYGYDLVAALRRVALNTPSKKLSELFNSLANTITSGGYLPNFFDKRSQSLLFDYRLEKEKYTKTAETFMDIYISVVVAAPMILMLLLMMMKISGLGISLSSSMITLIMVLGVSIINVVFLTFLHLKQPKG